MCIQAWSGVQSPTGAEATAERGQGVIPEGTPEISTALSPVCSPASCPCEADLTYQGLLNQHI